MTSRQTGLVNQVPSLASIAAKFGGQLSSGGDLVPSGVAIGSAYVEPGYLFVAVQGAKAHGLDFLDDAISKGAAALLTDRPGEYPLPTIVHPDPRSIAGLVSSEVFDSGKVDLVGITGTNGKTSTAIYLQRLLSALGESVGLITSHQQLVGDQVLDSELTTPEAPRLHQLLHKMQLAGQHRAVVEVSAQALTRARVEGLRFHVAGFTNLSRDHLDDYGDMDRYLEAKQSLFTAHYSDRAVVVCEDEWGSKLLDRIEIPKVGIGEHLDYQLELLPKGFKISGSAEVAAAGPMAKNLALAAILAIESGFDPKKVERALESIELSVPGRLEAVDDAGNVFVDYAHTPAGVAASVEYLLSTRGELVVVLGASGNRDKGKRAEMAKACSGVSRLYVTDQHPRDEDPAVIRAALMAAAQETGIDAVEVADPAEAISQAVDYAAGRAVLWCGPGALGYREIAGKKVPFDARKIAREVAGS
ncbi:MAG: UDP-N-acetylmuramoyl-L-alanyl-D-glutamate--2,6-diaminopimelate ligase [Actinobacteria bacterium]|nr:UDP-N-acetylmuramoyl-L-alanyl-D-glutamate--2,6-diaminopimelate ligase [Actinomycetota bacterium]